MRLIVLQKLDGFESTINPIHIEEMIPGGSAEKEHTYIRFASGESIYVKEDVGRIRSLINNFNPGNTQRLNED